MTTENANQKYLIVTALDTDYSIPVSDVDAVISLKRSEISPVPFDVGKRLRGIFNYKGGVTTLLRCEKLSVLSDETNAQNLTAILLHYENKSFAVLIDRAKWVTENSDNIKTLTAENIYGEDCYDNN